MQQRFIIAAGLMLALATPAFADLEWVFAYPDGDGNSQHTSSLAITTNPQNYHTVWDAKVTPSSNDYYSFISTTLIADNKIVTSINYIKKSDHSSFSNFTAMDADSGKTLWTVTTNGSKLDTLTYHKGKIITTLAGAEEKNFLLTAYDIKTGETIYSVNIDKNIDHLIPYGDSIYFSKKHNTIGSFNPNDGHLNWLQPLSTGNTFGSSLSVNSQYILTRDFDNVRIYDNRNGKELAKISEPDAFNDSRSFNAAPVINDDTAYTIYQTKAEHYPATLFAIDLKQQKTIWSVPNLFDEYSFTAERTLLLTNNVIIAQGYRTSSEGADNIHFIDAKSGNILGSWKVPDADKLALFLPYFMVATADTLFVASAHHVYAVSLQTHRIVWQYKVDATRLFLGAGKLIMEWQDEAKRETHFTAVQLN